MWKFNSVFYLTIYLLSVDFATSATNRILNNTNDKIIFVNELRINRISLPQSMRPPDMLDRSQQGDVNNRNIFEVPTNCGENEKSDSVGNCRKITYRVH
jgi:hypothetical protein